MRTPIYVRELTAKEEQEVEAGLRSQDGFRLRRCQIIAASARKERVPAIARVIGCDVQTVRNAIHAFDAQGVAVLNRRSTRPKHTQAAFSAEQAEQLKALLHRSPREFGQATSLWTLDLVAEVSFAEGLTRSRVSDETIRATLKRLQVNWKRAKKWITSPDPEYTRKKRSGPPDRSGCHPSRLGVGFPGRDVVESLCPAAGACLESR
jgi:transposase